MHNMELGAGGGGGERLYDRKRGQATSIHPSLSLSLSLSLFLLSPFSPLLLLPLSRHLNSINRSMFGFPFIRPAVLAANANKWELKIDAEVIIGSSGGVGGGVRGGGKGGGGVLPDMRLQHQH